jgi:uncharacterized protein (DUF427 family)
MAKATWNGATIAESDEFEFVENNVYFGKDALNADLLRPSTKTSGCPWKGTAHYYDVVVDGEVNKDAAWYYPEPKKAAENLRDRVAFWRGVKVEK